MKLLTWGVTGIALALSSTSALANTITVEDASNGGGVFNYDITLSPQSVVLPGDGFVIYDFAGFTGGATDLPGFTVYPVPVGTGTLVLDPVAALSLAGADDLAIPNIVVEYTGVLPYSGSLSGVLQLTSGASFTATEAYLSHDSENGGSNATGPVTVASTTPVPLPLATWAGLGLFGIVAGGKLRKRSAV